jgi:hypothetical protein
LYRVFKRPTDLYLSDEEIQLNSSTIQAKDIRMIMKTGYFRPKFGIKPIGKLVVPNHLCFRFSKDKDRGETDITQWAEKNKVKLVNRPFMRW